MGQKVNPNGLRLGINKDWEAKWYAGKKDFAKTLKQDVLIREYFEKNMKNAGIAKVEIERNAKRCEVTVHTSKPGVMIGKGGEEIEKLKTTLSNITGEKIQISIVDIKKAELNAQLVADDIARQISNRISFRMAQKRAVQTIMRAGAKGCKTMISGRVNGAEIARSEQYREGVLSLHTLSQNIDYALCEAHTTYGRLGCKVWISLPSKEELEALARSRAQRDGRRFNNRGSRGGNNGRRDNRHPAKEAAKKAAPVADEKKGE